MNILFYIDRYPGYGGIENVTSVLSNYLVCQGYNVTIFSFRSQAVGVLLPKLCRGVEYVIARDEGIWKSKANEEQLAKLIEGRKIDVCVFQDSYAPIEDMIIKLCRQHGVKLFTVEHNTPDCFLKAFEHLGSNNLFHRLKRPLSKVKLMFLIRRRHRKLFFASDKYVFLSDKYYSIMQRITRLPITKIKEHACFVNNPITVEKAPEVEKQKLCLFLCRLDSQKAPDKLLRIWQSVTAKHLDWSFVVVGDGPEREKMERFVKQKGMKNVRFDGFQCDTAKYYSKASILCVTSIFEGWSLNLCEAMNNGCVPILFDSYASASDIVKDGITGFLIPTFDESLYASRLSQLIENEKMRNKMRAAALEDVKRFDMSVIGKRWDSLLKEIRDE